jgi:glyoxylase-like metal-dependent hydrolase (beta-lactamase superfamily II)
MLITEIVCTPFQQNTRIVACEKTRKAICIDPGEESEEIVDAIERNGFELQAITLTHAHMDHAGGTAALKERFPNAKVILHSADEPLYFALPEQPALLGIPRSEWSRLGFDYDEPPKPDEYWADGQTYRLGELEFKVIHCPGHTPGHVVLFEPNERKVFVGDCLFAGSIGRTDLPGGSSAQLMDSLMNKIVPLGDDVEVYSGHGPVTTIGEERLSNPFLNGMYATGRLL